MSFFEIGRKASDAMGRAATMLKKKSWRTMGDVANEVKYASTQHAKQWKEVVEIDGHSDRGIVIDSLPLVERMLHGTKRREYMRVYFPSRSAQGNMRRSIEIKRRMRSLGAGITYITDNKDLDRVGVNLVVGQRDVPYFPDDPEVPLSNAVAIVCKNFPMVQFGDLAAACLGCNVTTVVVPEGCAKICTGVNALRQSDGGVELLDLYQTSSVSSLVGFFRHLGYHIVVQTHTSSGTPVDVHPAISSSEKTLFLLQGEGPSSLGDVVPDTLLSPPSFANIPLPPLPAATSALSLIERDITDRVGVNLVSAEPETNREK
eukprot:TRINITY_DN24462_c0_g1_i1.p1 TRINITY_DN24462_c0_g1~~TRINITY_DN24462_c0_g1_i1.p1  ORF type:complete len:317 (+),score=54.40 TRINITY_DN24462_c0_g1_i1:76-1026(+)